jgi:hypothetical protein
MICPDCHQELSKVLFKGENGIREIYCHTLPTTCQYQQDGVKLTIEIIDEFLIETFQKYLKDNSGLQQQQNHLEQAKIETKVILSKTNLEKIKDRLCNAELSLSEYDEILKRIIDS